MRRGFLRVGLTAVLTLCVGGSHSFAQNDDARLREDVLAAIKQAQRFLRRKQRSDGSWKDDHSTQYPHGLTSLALLALVNSGMTEKDPEVRKALKYIRALPDGQPSKVYSVSLTISALVAAKAKGKRDYRQIYKLAEWLEEAQTDKGSWGYGTRGGLGGGDPSNAQFGVLGLRDAATVGYRVDPAVWLKARDHWRIRQSRSGAWSYRNSYWNGSMTCAGIATLAIAQRMLRNDRDVRPDGTVDCCRPTTSDPGLRLGLDWLARNFSVQANPGSQGAHVMYYLYALERAGRLTGRRFIGQNDWYREGARQLALSQKAAGDWEAGERGIVAASFGLLFLSKGLVPVVMNKLEYGAPDPRNPNRPGSLDWDNHHDDARNLIELISGLEDWPRLMTHQTVNMYRLQPETAVSELAQAPICYLSGSQRPAFPEDQVAALRAYVDQGGFIVAVATCDSQDFDPGLRDLIQRMFPEGGAELKRLDADHPIFRSEFQLPADTIELYGVDFGCRTPIIYSPVDLACYWNKWMKIEPPDRKDLPQQAQDRLRTRITRDTRIGVNIVAYATGREPPGKLDDTGTDPIKRQDEARRGLLEIAKLKHSGGWDTAPRALRNLLVAVNETVGVSAATRTKSLPVMSGDIFNHPMLYMHGRHAFQFSRQEREQLRGYLDRGNVLFADACCGSTQFDKSFRAMISEMFKDTEGAKLVRVPVDHELFSVAHDIKSVERRIPAVGKNAKFEARVERGEPFLEGVEIDGRLAVIYSKYDISCALEQQSTAACRGYVAEDALKIALNIVVYGMRQDL